VRPATCSGTIAQDLQGSLVSLIKTGGIPLTAA
jgi:hypothetical protein